MFNWIHRLACSGSFNLYIIETVMEQRDICIMGACLMMVLDWTVITTDPACISISN